MFVTCNGKHMGNGYTSRHKRCKNYTNRMDLRKINRSDHSSIFLKFHTYILYVKRTNKNKIFLYIMLCSLKNFCKVFIKFHLNILFSQNKNFGYNSLHKTWRKINQSIAYENVLRHNPIYVCACALMLFLGRTN